MRNKPLAPRTNPGHAGAVIAAGPRQYEHQKSDLERSRSLHAWAWWWEMGLGKTKQAIDTALYLHQCDKISGVLVLAPNGVHANWLGQEVSQHAHGTAYRGHTYSTDSAGTKQHQQRLSQLLDVEHEPRELCWLAMSYDATCTERGWKAAHQFCSSRSVLLVADESTAIKTPNAKRTRRAMALAKLAKYRRAMDGTPVSNSPFDVYQQIKFLDLEFWERLGLGSFFSFKQEFGSWLLQRAAAGHQFHKLLKYRNLERLQEIMSQIGSRCTKAQALDLPPKVYSSIHFDLTPKQRQAYDTLREDFAAQLDSGESVEAQEAMVRLTRLQQIASGYAAVSSPWQPQVGDEVLAVVNPAVFEGVKDLYDTISGTPDIQVVATIAACHENGDVSLTQGGDINITIDASETEARLVPIKKQPPHLVELVEPEQNPRLQALLEKLGQCDQTTKVIVWCRFVRDVDVVVAALASECARYDGQVKDRDRQDALQRFRTDAGCRVLVANPAAIARGVTLTQATVVFYYSNSFDLVHRLQSEDRCHRIGQNSTVLYYDLVANDTVDLHVRKRLMEKHAVASVVTGDELREWLR